MLEGIIAATVGAFSAFMFNVLHLDSAERSKKIENLASIVVNNIIELESKAVSYWLTHADSANNGLKSLEIELKSRCFINQKLIYNFLTILPGDVPLAIRVQLTKFSEEIFDLATGGDFESCQRKNNPKLALKLSRKCTMARINLLKSIHYYEKKSFLKVIFAAIFRK